MSFANRTNFALQALGMFVNNVVMLALWWLFFEGFKSVAGWQRADVALLMGITMTIVGICGVFCGGYRDLAATVLRGELDPLLTQPKALLPRLLAKESMATAWGDLIGGPLLLVWFVNLTLAQVPLLFIALIAGAIVFLGAAIAFASMAFWAAGARSFARELVDFTILFSTYPGSIYQGALRVVAYTLLPAGFIVMLPIEFVHAPTLGNLLVMGAGTLVYASFALALFRVGLARYRRGSSPQT